MTRQTRRSKRIPTLSPWPKSGEPRVSSRTGAQVYPAYEVIPSFDELYRKEWRYVAAVAERLMVRKADVRDVVQEVFIKAYRGLAKVENPGAVRGWLATITVRAVSDRLRRKKWQQTLLFQSEQLDDLPAHEVSAEVLVEVRQLQRALERLPVKERIAWGLRHIEQEPLDRVAELCECSLATAKRRIVAAQEKLDAYTSNKHRGGRGDSPVASARRSPGGGREGDEP